MVLISYKSADKPLSRVTLVPAELSGEYKRLSNQVSVTQNKTTNYFQCVEWKYVDSPLCVRWWRKKGICSYFHCWINTQYILQLYFFIPVTGVTWCRYLIMHVNAEKKSKRSWCRFACSFCHSQFQPNQMKEIKTPHSKWHLASPLSPSQTARNTLPSTALTL